MGLFGHGGLLSKAGHAIEKQIVNTAKGVDRVMDRIGEDVGGWVNDMSGATQKHQWAVEDANTARQRAIEDMQAAGINPVLAAGNLTDGATVQENPNPSATIGIPGVSDIINSALTLAQTEKTEAETDLTAKQAGKTDKEIETMDIQNGIAKAVSSADIKLKTAQTNVEKQKVHTELQKTLALEFDNKMKKMNVDKRSGQYENELELYKQEIMKQLINAGYENSTVGTIIRGIGDTIKKLSPLTEFTGQSNSARGTTEYHYTNVNY